MCPRIPNRPLSHLHLLLLRFLMHHWIETPTEDETPAMAVIKEAAVEAFLDAADIRMHAEEEEEGNRNPLTMVLRFVVLSCFCRVSAFNFHT